MKAMRGIRCGLAAVGLMVCGIMGMRSAFAAPIYLKADAAAGGDGASWSTAYNAVADAIEALNASTDSPAELRIAGGVYQYSAAMMLSNVNFIVKGGYRAESDGDETRDSKEYQTIVFPGTAAQLEARYLIHYAPHETGLNLVKSDTKLFYKDGKLQFPEDNGWYTGALDCYCQHGYFGIKETIALTVTSGAGGTLAGVSFVGGNRTPHLSIASGALDTVVEDCGFYFGYPQGTLVVSSAKTTFRRCSFRFNEVPYGGGLLSAGATSVIEDCVISDNVPNRYYNQQLVSTSGTMTNCVFRRNLVYYNESLKCGNIAGLLVAGSGARIVGTAFSNNFHSVIGTFNISPVLATGALFERCAFANNLMRVNPQSGFTYALVQSTYQAYNNTFDGCLFASNRIEGVATPTGDFAMAMVAGSVEGSKLAVVNTTFLSNEVAAVDADQVTASLSRGVLTRASAASVSSSQLGLANCTFIGAATPGVKDVIQLGSSHAKTLEIVNSIFQTDSVEPVNPFAFDVPSVVSIRDCTIKNMLAAYHPTDYDLSSGLQTDEVPHILDGAVLRPTAKTPGLRTSADVAITDATVPRTYQYRPRGAETWTPLVTGMKNAVVGDAAAISDAAGALRTFGTMTRGAVQALKEPAETGASLTVRTEPLTAGAVSSSAQATTAGGAIVPVMATASEGTTFLGWYKENGELYDSNAMLNIASLSSDLVLVAKFSTRQVTIRYDLQGKGVFAENNETTIEKTSEAGAAFPEIPEHTLSEGWFLYDPKTPAVVPDSQETVVVQPEIISTGVRIVYLTPEGAGERDGSSWDNAYGSVADAIADAGKIRGEVWAKAGKYVLAASVAMKANVTLRGGFAGYETSATAADPKAYPTIFTGDVNANDTWVGVLDGKASNQTALWDADSQAYTRPNPNGEHDYWKATGNIAENTTIGFNSAEAGIENVGFVGVTFASFRYSAIYNLGYWENLTVSNCTFIGCGGSTAKDTLNAYYSALHGRTRGNSAIADSTFVGNTYCLYLASGAEADDATNEIVRCTLDGNNTQGIAVTTATSAVTRVEHLYAVSNGVGTWVSFNSSSDLGRFYLADSRFVSNRQRNGGTLVSASANASQQINCNFIDRCLFEENVLNTMGSGVLGVYVGGNSYHNVYVRDCCWRANTINIKGGVKDESAAIAGRTKVYSQLYFADCTFADNAVNSTDYTATNARAGILAKDQHYSRLAAINCTFCGNHFTTGHEANEAECVMPYSSASWRPLTLVNCAVDNADGHRVFSGMDSSYGSLNNCAVTHFDIGDTGMPAENVSTNGLVVADPKLKAAITENADGLKAWGLAHDSAFRKSAYPLALDDDGHIYYYAYVEKDKAMKWCSIGDWKSLTIAEAEAKGVSLDNLKPDAFGQTRNRKWCALGALNAEKVGFLLFVR